MKAVPICRRCPSGWLALCLLLVATKSVLATTEAESKPHKVEVRKTTENTKTPAQDLLDQLVATIGDVYSFTRVQIESTGSAWTRYEAVRPGLRSATSTYKQTVALDLRTSSQRMEVAQTLLFGAFDGDQVTNRIVIAGTVGGGTGQLGFVSPGTYPSQTVAALKRQQELFNPHILLRKALKQPKMLSLMFGSTGGGLPILRYNDGHFMIRIFSDENGFITQLSVLESNPLTRDVAVFVKFYDWTIDASGVLFPKRVQMAGPDQIVIWEEVRTSVKVDPILPQGYFKLLSGTDANSYDAKDYLFGLQAHHHVITFFSAGFHYTYDNTYKAPQEVVPGVYWLQSGANSLLIEHDDGWILVEAAGSEVQAKNLLSTVLDFAGDYGSGKSYSGKTDDYKDDYKSDITHLIQSHHHVDHAAGVRQVLAETGATLVVGFGIRDFYEKRVLLAPSTVRPDGFTGKTTVSNIVRGVATKHGSIRLINTMELTVEVYHTVRFTHASDMVFVVVDNIVAGELVLYEADFFNAGTGFVLLPGGPQALFDSMRDIGLIDARCESSYPLTIVPAHGVPSTLEAVIAELDKIGEDVGC
jgi:glyoxylase-like metal-dependent hydrolase (beta-lactamase superfamily II)